VQVGVGRPRHLQAAPGGCRPQRPKVAWRVDGKGPSVADVEQVGAVAQAVVD
jgi:hypothetical protein